ncbi:NAD(P)/FAD-dependent oxidoreductase [Halovulum sp. GXIMD14793]
MHVVIAGAGIVGVSAAIWLQRAGHEVTLVDRTGPAAGASYGNAGVLAASAILPLVTPQTLRSLPGMVFQDYDFDIQVLTGAEVAAKEPMLAQAFETLVVCPNHGRISDPGAYVEALAAHFEAEGGQIKIAEIEGVDTDGPCPALLAGGQRIAGDRLVLALGAWSGALARSLGLQGLKLESERGYHVELIAPSDMPRAPILVTEGEFVITPMQGRLRVGGLVEFSGLKAAPHAAPEAYLRRRISQLMPDLTYEDTKIWMGHRPVTADGLPVIGPLDDRGHCLAAFGHQHVGLTAGPKTGRLIADMVDGRKANSDLSPFSPERYLK